MNIDQYLDAHFDQDLAEELDAIVDQFLPITALDMGCSRRMDAKNKQRETAKQCIIGLIDKTMQITMSVAKSASTNGEESE